MNSLKQHLSKFSVLRSPFSVLRSPFSVLRRNCDQILKMDDTKEQWQVF